MFVLNVEELLKLLWSDNMFENMNDIELCELFMRVDIDRKVMPVAERIYWKLIKEINRRAELEK